MVKLKSYSSSNTLLFCPSITFQFRVSPVLTEPDERDQAMALGDTSELSGSVRLLILLFVILRQSLMQPGLVLPPWFWPPTTIYQVLEIQVRGTNTLCCCCLEAGSPSSPAWPKLTTMLLLGLNSQGTLLAQVLRLQVWNSMAHPPLSFLCYFLGSDTYMTTNQETYQNWWVCMHAHTLSSEFKDKFKITHFHTIVCD